VHKHHQQAKGHTAMKIYTREFFQKTGRKGGKAAAAKLTPEERSARAKHAVTVRETKRAEKKGEAA
jgi:hypothetical protein